MNRLGKFLIITLSFASIIGVIFGVNQSIHSRLFTVQSVEVSSSSEQPPFEDSVILKLANVPVGKVSLFDLDLRVIERRLLSHEWIRSVGLQKRMPKTLLISINYREPQAIIQTGKGSLAYVDIDGKIFGTVDLTRASDLPFLSNFTGQSPEKIREALQLLKAWENSPLNGISVVSSIQFDPERGFRVLIAYPLGTKNLTSEENLNSRTRAMVELGQFMDRNFEEKFLQLSKVLRYLSGNSIAVRQVWADAGKKIVVKTAHGS